LGLVVFFIEETENSTKKQHSNIPFQFQILLNSQDPSLTSNKIIKTITTSISNILVEFCRQEKGPLSIV